MKTVSSFHKLTPDPKANQPDVPVYFDGQELHLPKGANLAASLLAAGVNVFRNTPTSGAPRAPHCMMGTCFDCVVEIDGVTRQACQTQVQENMQISKPTPTEAEDSHA